MLYASWQWAVLQHLTLNLSCTALWRAPAVAKMPQIKDTVDLHTLSPLRLALPGCLHLAGLLAGLHSHGCTVSVGAGLCHIAYADALAS